MKKLLVLLLALAMVLTMFVACKSDKDKDDNKDDKTKATTTTKDPGTQNKPDADGFTAADKTLYVCLDDDGGSLNVREAPSAEEGVKILGTLPQGASVKVTAENATIGWSRIDYNGAVGYVNSTYLSAEKPNVDVIDDTLFTEANEKVYAYATGGADDAHLPDVDVKAYLRAYKEGWSDKKADYLFENYTELTRTGIYTDENGNGWSKISYHDAEIDKDVTLYIRNSQLVTELPADVNTNA